ncbi:MAG: geranylgeranylglyceryl/heptaprenylglyceryl phosphate synthase [Candidatus Anstonellaceae archaeon]
MGIVVPSIDLLAGRAVRLCQGKRETAEVLGEPLSLAEKYAKLGFEWLHVVDLDAAFGRRRQAKLVAAIAKRKGKMKLQVGGGIRSCNASSEAVAAGADRVVFGTALFESKGEVQKAAEELGAEKVWAGIDFAGKPPCAKIRGWTKETKIGLEGALLAAEECGVGGVVIGAVDADGMQQGPDVSLVSEARELFVGGIWLAGGMRNATDAEKAFDAGADAVIFGRALYGKGINLGELSCLQRE